MSYTIDQGHPAYAVVDELQKQTDRANELEAIRTQHDAEIAQLNQQVADLQKAIKEDWEIKADQILFAATVLDNIAVPYVFGGASAAGMDCSGMTKQLFKVAGVSLPHTSAGQATMGTDVPYAQLRKGDLVFFCTNATNDKEVTHVGISMGGGKFIHTNTPATGINLKDMETKADAYWKGRFLNARRFL